MYCYVNKGNLESPLVYLCDSKAMATETETTFSLYFHPNRLMISKQIVAFSWKTFSLVVALDTCCSRAHKPTTLHLITLDNSTRKPATLVNKLPISRSISNKFRSASKDATRRNIQQDATNQQQPQ